MNSVLRFSIYSVLRIRSTIPAQVNLVPWKVWNSTCSKKIWQHCDKHCLTSVWSCELWTSTFCDLQLNPLLNQILESNWKSHCSLDIRHTIDSTKQILLMMLTNSEVKNVDFFEEIIIQDLKRAFGTEKFKPKALIFCILVDFWLGTLIFGPLIFMVFRGSWQVGHSFESN